MTTSQNGWMASTDKAAIGIANPSVSGVDFPNGVRGGDVQVVLMYVAGRFHATVEALHDGWCWGYAYREIEGSSSLSNHASGTAIDLNAPRHPMGKAGTFTAAQVAAIRMILAFLEGVVRWGGDYSGRKDEMHFEIHADADAVARIARKVTAAPGPHWTETVVNTLPTLRKGNTGTPVKRLQALLNVAGQRLTEDGSFGPLTDAAVRAEQRQAGIGVDGIAGRQTWSTLLGV